MAKKPEVRYQNVNQIIKDVRFFQEGFATQAEDLTIKKSLILSYKRNRFKYIVFSAATLITVLASVFVSLKISQMQKDHIAEIQSINDKKNKEYEKLINQNKRTSQRLKKHITKSKQSLEAIKSKYDSIVLSPPLIIGTGVTLNGNGSGLLDENFIFHSGTVSFWFKPKEYKQVHAEFLQLGNMKWYLGFSKAYENSDRPLIVGSTVTFSHKKLGNSLWRGWHHFACTALKSGMIMCYIDGKPYYIGEIYNGKQLGFSLGRFNPTKGIHNFYGSFSKVTFWRDILSPNDIKELQHKGIRGDEDGLKAYFPLDKDFKDSVGNEPELKPSGKYSFTK